MYVLKFEIASSSWDVIAEPGSGQLANLNLEDVELDSGSPGHVWSGCHWPHLNGSTANVLVTLSYRGRPPPGPGP